MSTDPQSFYGQGQAPHDDRQLLIWEASQILQEGFSYHSGELPRLLDLAHNLHNILENTRATYNSLVAERDAVYRKLQNADNKLLQVENIVRRYAVVRDPVVASDGFTYERSALRQYLLECSQSNSKAYSQQTKEELSDTMVSNLSLSRLIDLLKGVRTTEIPQFTHRGAITAPVPQRGGWADETGAPPARWAGNTPSAILKAPPGNAGVTATGGSAGESNPEPPSRTSVANAAQVVGVKNRDPSSVKLPKSDSEGGRNALGTHPCLRVFGFCRFMEDCTFANYPYPACLNHIKGKCRFGRNCKELHVDPRDPRYQNASSCAPGGHTYGGGGGAKAHDNSDSAAPNAVSAAEGTEEADPNETKPDPEVVQQTAEESLAAATAPEQAQTEETKGANTEAMESTDAGES